MEAVGAVANVIAVVDLSAKVATLCYRYSQDVSSARADIERLRRQAEHLQITLNAAKTLVERSNSPPFSNSTAIIKAFGSCRTNLEYVLKKLDPNPLRSAMRRYGWRAFKWPFKSEEIDQLLAELKDYENTISMGLQLDQCGMLESIKEGVDRLQLQPTENAMAYKKPHSWIPFTPDPDFIHRPSIEDWMKDQFARPSQRMALVGMGGFGKSKLAIQFGHQVFTDHGSSVFWVHGGNKAAFEESYRALADLHELPRRHETEVNILALVRDWLQRDDIHPWFMIVDNADDGKVLFSRNECLALYLPKSTRGKLLVTSRSLDAAQRLVGNTKAIYRIPIMAEDEALELFQSLLEVKAKVDEALELVRALECIPLAVKQAAAYINHRSPRVTIQAYLKDFCKSEERKDSLLRSDKGDLDRQDGVSNSVVVTWQVTLKQIRAEHPSAANLLSLMSQFQAQNIPEYMLQWYDDGYLTDDKENVDDEVGVDREGESDGGSDLESASSSGIDDDINSESECMAFENDLDILRSYSLVDMSIEGHLSMHSLVQFCTRQWVSELSGSSRWYCLFVKLAAKHFPDGSFEHWPVCQTLLPHVEPVLGMKPNEHSAICYWAELLTRVSCYMRAIGQYSRAQILAEKSVETRSNLLGQDHPKTLESKSTLATTLLVRRRLQEAEELGGELVETKKAALGVGHRSTLSAMSDLAAVLSAQGRLDEAEKLGVEVLERQRATLGLQHNNTLVSMNDLAITLGRQGRLDEAETLLLEISKIDQATLGPSHPTTLTGMHNLARTLKEKGQLHDSRTLQVEVVARRQVTLGPHHPDTLGSMVNLTSILRSQGRLQELESLQVEILERQKMIHGFAHHKTLTALAALSQTLYKQGRFEEAEELQLKALEGRKITLGISHPKTLKSMRKLAWTWHQQGRLKAALVLMQDYARLQEERLGYRDPHTQASLQTVQEWQAEIPLPKETENEW